MMCRHAFLAIIAFARPVAAFPALFILLLLPPTPAFAATKNLNGSVGGCPLGSNWSTSACWTPAGAPGTGDDVVIDMSQGAGGAACPTNYDLPSTVQLHSLTMNSCNGGGGILAIAGGPIVLQSGGTITDTFNNANTSPADSVPGVTLNGSTTFSLATSGGNADALHFTGAITGTGPLTLSSTGPTDGLQLLTVNSYTGATTVSGTARVRFDVNGAVPTSSALTVNGSALFQAASTIGSLAGGGNVFMNGSNALTVGGDNTSTTFSGVYQNSGGAAALTKAGTGTLTLSGANTYTGATTVNAGTLAVNGSIASPVTVNSGGTLGGTGTFNAVTVNNGGTLGPGLSTGIMNTGNLTLTSGSTLTIEINGPTVGTQYDQVNVTGTVTLGGATLNVVLGFTPTAGQVFTIINNDSTDAVTGTFAGLPEGATFTVGSTQFHISYVGSNDVTLTAVGTQAIPTLSEWAQLAMVALLVGGGLLALRRHVRPA
ncbi:MAG: IPTL-CTERM sorting domain-containing protein [Candidatus Methylomirabilis oxygeniifera]|nr:MAG: IPTL-CTERM sorting domain-containing protein [Candidatus Methylomirabilis oxyfera]